jgi:16S rRNA (guanine527-N7)-methyltransferase
VLLEATGKKVRFLQHMIEALQLKDVVVVRGRAEELAHKAEYRGSFDVVTARAVASLPALLEYAAPFCHLGGQIIFLKKAIWQKNWLEVNALLLKWERASRLIFL